ncbi:MAG: hypothetical protein WC358_11910 [Ignavibacteria bacterium]|jgi:aromatic ring-opening dioxygenase catalytic subunit (LigB family)
MKKNIVFVLSLLFFTFVFSSAFSQTFKELVAEYRESQKEKDFEESIEILDLMLEKYPNTEPEIHILTAVIHIGNLRNIKKQSSIIQKLLK